MGQPLNYLFQNDLAKVSGSEVAGNIHASGAVEYLLELEVEHRTAARHALWYERPQVPRQNARVEQTVAYEVHELGELFIGELERRLEQRVETRQDWLDWAEGSLQVWRKITWRVLAR